MRNRTLVAILIAILVVGGAYIGQMAARGGTTTTVTASGQSGITSYSVCFSPAGNCAAVISALIAEANSSIHIEIYTFTNTALADALVAAKDRGVDVEVFMDGSEADNDNIAVVSILNQGGVPLKIYSPPNGIVHDKVAIIDDKIVITGSYNWSYSANDDNDENLLVLNSTSLASQYEANFESLWSLVNATS